MKVADIMNSPVVFTQPKVKVSSLKKMLSRKHINAVPVIDEDESIKGIISTSNIISCQDESLPTESLMSECIHVVMPSNRVKDAARIMVKHGVHHLVVMEVGKVVGTLSSMDIIKVYAEMD